MSLLSGCATFETLHRKLADESSADEYLRLFDLWCDAQKAAHAAAIAIWDDLDGKPVDAERRDEAGRLAVEAKRLMMETLRAAPPSTRF